MLIKLVKNSWEFSGVFWSKGEGLSFIEMDEDWAGRGNKGKIWGENNENWVRIRNILIKLKNISEKLRKIKENLGNFSGSSEKNRKIQWKIQRKLKEI